MTGTRLSVALCLLTAAIFGRQSLAHRLKQPADGPSFSGLPERIGDWRSVELDLDPRLVKAVGVDDYVYRRYCRRPGAEIELYTGFYRQQAGDKLVHSPRNCLAGTGWYTVRTSVIQILRPEAAPVWVNEHIVARGGRRLMVHYWFHVQDRVLASEANLKLWNLVNALTQGRSDGGLVRLSTELSDGEERARCELARFQDSLFPILRQVMPGGVTQSRTPFGGN